MEDENAILETSENMIKKLLYFKHDEEFSKEVKEKGKEIAVKKRNKSKERSKEREKEEMKKDPEANSKEGNKEETKEGDKNEELKDEISITKKSESSDALIIKKPILSKIKLVKSSESTVIRKSDIAYIPFKNCSGVKLEHFVEQLKFIETKAKSIFIKACNNLCEIEHIKEYDLDMNVKKEYKIIQLKDEVLKDLISKRVKENAANLKNQNPSAERKKLVEEKQIKSGSQTARPKSSSSSNLGTHTKRDNFLMSSLLSAQTTFPKEKKKIVMSILEKIVDKYTN